MSDPGSTTYSLTNGVVMSNKIYLTIFQAPKNFCEY